MIILTTLKNPIMTFSNQYRTMIAAKLQPKKRTPISGTRLKKINEMTETLNIGTIVFK
jgi:hypothetical protein